MDVLKVVAILLWYHSVYSKTIISHLCGFIFEIHWWVCYSATTFYENCAYYNCLRLPFVVAPVCCFNRRSWGWSRHANSVLLVVMVLVKLRCSY